MKTLEFKSMYEIYPLYQIMYGRDIDTKAYEALNASIAAEHFWINEMKKKGSLRVLELFAGKSEHKQYFMQSCTVPIELYDCLDNQPEVIGGDVVFGDAIESIYPKKYNFIIAHYYSLDTCTIYRDKLIGLMRNVYGNLSNFKRNKSGAFFFHLSSDGYRNALLNVGEPIKGFKYFVPPAHPLRTMFNVDPYDTTCHVQADTKREYNRITCINYDFVSNTKLMVRGKAVAQFSFDEPFCHRFWSEPEVVDIALDAGFKKIEFYNNGVSSGHDILTSNRTTLPNSMKYPNIPYDDDSYEDGGALENYMTTDMMVIL